jgi:hypothetical protein
LLKQTIDVGKNDWVFWLDLLLKFISAFKMGDMFN